MKKTLIVFLGLLFATTGCDALKGIFSKVEVEASHSKNEKEGTETFQAKISVTLSSATWRLNKKLGELELAVAEVNAQHEQVRGLSNQVQQEYAELVYELNPLPQGEIFLHVMAAVKPANGEKGNALEQLEQRVRFVEFRTNTSFLTFEQQFEEVCRLTDNKSEEWKGTQRSKMEALTVSLHKVKHLVADIEDLAPEVSKEVGSRPKLRDPLVRLQGDFLGGLVTVNPKNAMLEELFQVTKSWRTQPERPNLKLAVHELALTELAKELQQETAKSN